MTLSFGDALLLAVVLLSGIAAGAPHFALYLVARKQERLAKVVAAGGRLAFTIAAKLRELPAGADREQMKAQLVAAAVETMKSPEMLKGPIKRGGYGDVGLANIVEGQVNQIELGVMPKSVAP